jgi:hypothetical protein
VNFTQFLRPNGHKQIIIITVPEEYEARAKELTDAGYKFEIEVLRNGVVSMECCDEEDCLSMQLVDNGPKVPDMVKVLVDEAHETWVKRGRTSVLRTQPMTGDVN